MFVDASGEIQDNEPNPQEKGGGGEQQSRGLKPGTLVTKAATRRFVGVVRPWPVWSCTRINLSIYVRSTTSTALLV